MKKRSVRSKKLANKTNPSHKNYLMVQWTFNPLVNLIYSKATKRLKVKFWTKNLIRQKKKMFGIVYQNGCISCQGLALLFLSLIYLLSLFGILNLLRTEHYCCLSCRLTYCAKDFDSTIVSSFLIKLCITMFSL